MQKQHGTSIKPGTVTKGIELRCSYFLTKLPNTHIGKETAPLTNGARKNIISMYKDVD